jgi:hypothetical protein
MAQTIDEKATESAPGTDMVAAVLRVLSVSSEPMTVSKIRAKLPAPFRSASLEELADTLQRQVAANVLFQYPKYRSQQDRFWDRPMSVHLTALLREALEEGPLGWPELRRKLPAYALDPLTQVEAALTDLVGRGELHRHPRSGKRGGDRFGVRPPDAKQYLEAELSAVFRDLEQLGFSQAQLRAAALELLHDEEWSPTASPERTRASAGGGAEATPGQEAETERPEPSASDEMARSQEGLGTEHPQRSSTVSAQPAPEHAQPDAQASPADSNRP